jgi:hypothetical protein
MKRFTEFLLEDPVGGTKPTPAPRVVQKPPVKETEGTTTFSNVHRDIYGNKSQGLIDDALAARRAAAGTEHDIGDSGFANLGRYDLFAKSPIHQIMGRKKTAAQDIPMEGEAQQRTSFDPSKPTTMTLYDIPTIRRDKDGNLLRPMDPAAVRRHEAEHTTQLSPDTGFKSGSVEQTIGRPLSDKEKYLYDPSEMSAYQSGYEAAYFKKTGKTLPSGLSDKDYDEFVKWAASPGSGVHPEHLELMKNSEYRQRMIDLAKQTAQVQQQARTAAGEGTMSA